MSIPNYTQPTSDFTTGYTIQPSDWNNNFDGLATYLNGTLVPALNGLLAGGVPAIGAQGTAGGRLTLRSGDPASMLQNLNQTNVFYTPFIHDQIGLWTGSAWTLTKFTEIQIPLTSVLQWVNYDVFIYNSSGVLVGEVVPWYSAQPSANITAGSNVTINFATLGGNTATIGEWVTIRSGATIERCQVTNNGTNTITVASVANSYTAGSTQIYFNFRGVPLSQIDNVYVKSTANQRLFVGTIRGSIDGACTDTPNGTRYVWNNFNRVQRVLLCGDSTASWTYGTATARPSNNNTSEGVGRTGWVTGLPTDEFMGVFVQPAQNGTPAASAGLGYNTVSAFGTGALTLFQQASGNQSGSSAVSLLVTTGGGVPMAGYNFLQNMEQPQSAGTVTYFGNTAAGNKINGQFTIIRA